MGVCLGGTGRVAGFNSASVISQGTAWPLTPTPTQGILRHPLEQALLWCFLPALGAVARATFLGEASQVPGDVGGGAGRLIEHKVRSRGTEGRTSAEWLRA